MTFYLEWDRAAAPGWHLSDTRLVLGPLGLFSLQNAEIFQQWSVEPRSLARPRSNKAYRWGKFSAVRYGLLSLNIKFLSAGHGQPI